MHIRRKETAPILLFTLAAAALGTSAAVTRDAATPRDQVAECRPKRTTAPIRWPEPALRMLEAELQAATPVEAPLVLEDSNRDWLEVRLTFDALVDPPQSYLVAESDPLVTAPLQIRVPEGVDSHGSELDAPTLAVAVPAVAPGLVVEATPREPIVVLAPSQPLWRSGMSREIVVTEAVRRNWSVGRLDTIATFRAAGSWVSRWNGDLPTEWVGARLRTAQRELGRLLATAPVVEPPMRVAAVAPRLVEPEVQAVEQAAQPTPAVANAAAEPASVEVVESAEEIAPALTLTRSPAPAPAPSTIVEYLKRTPSTGAFPIAESLGEQLDRVADDRDLAPWAWAAAYRLRNLVQAPVNDVATHRSLTALSDAVDEAFANADQLRDPAMATELRRAGYALSRRLSTWRAEQTQTLAMLSRPQPSDPLQGARWALSGSGVGHGFMLQEPAFVGAHNPLRVAQRIEEYESAPSPSLARSLANDAAVLASGADRESIALAEAINGHYRNANVRVAIAAELIERLLPSPEPITSAVRDRIAGTPVSGRSTTRAELAVRLVEDPSAWRLGLEAHGVVTAQTYSRGGPAVVGTRGATSFVAKKLLVVTPNGMVAAPSVADATSSSQRLVSIATDYDRVPVVGGYVRSAARSEYGKLRARAQAETRFKVERQASQTLDARVTPRLAEVEKRFADDVVDRVTALGMKIEPIEMRTTDRRLISRVRIANSSQLAAHTPRMRAPSDSFFSLQLHESTLNNALQGLGLAGATLTTGELRERLTERLQLPESGEPIAEEAVLRFAEVDPIVLRLTEGQAQLTLALDEIRVRGTSRRDFKVHAFYKPVVDGLTAELVQEGAPHIEGRMRTAARMHLHGVMGRVLGESRRLPLVRLTDETPEGVIAALDGLVTNQFVIEDGWIGIAIGPQRPVGRVASQVGGYVR